MQAPLEQFQILSLFNIKLCNTDFSLSNFLLINLIVLTGYTCLIYFNCLINSKKSYLYFTPNAGQKCINSITELSLELASDLIISFCNESIPFVATLLNFILSSNLIGLIPYAFTTTSHLVITFALSFSIFIGVTIRTFNNYKMKAFALFLPPRTSLFLALLLVPIEFISYLAKPISLGVRLFINLMAGHSLLKVIIGFSWSLLLLENPIIYPVSALIPMIILSILFCLELGVALIQTYVFITLTCMYIQDAT